MQRPLVSISIAIHPKSTRKLFLYILLRYQKQITHLKMCRNRRFIHDYYRLKPKSSHKSKKNQKISPLSIGIEITEVKLFSPKNAKSI